MNGTLGRFEMTDQTEKIWYCGVDGRRYGPMSFEDLQAMADQGSLRPGDLVWCPDFGRTWRAAETVEGLAFPETSGDPGFAPPPPFANRPAPEPIEMPSTPLTGVEGEEPSAREAGGRAWRRMKAILFQPFSFARWCGIALALFFSMLGAGGGCNVNLNNGGIIDQIKSMDLSSLDAQSIATQLGKIAEAQKTPSLPIPASAFEWAVVAISIAFGLVIGIAFCWIRARATFAVLHKMHRPDAPWVESWQVGNAGGIANSLFLWRIGIGAAFLGAIAVIVIGAVLSGVSGMLDADADFMTALPMMMIWFCIFMVVAAAWSLLLSLTTQFLEPIMYWRQVGAIKAWKILNEFCTQCAGAVFRYYIMLCAWWFVAIAAVLGLMLCTIGIYLVLLLLPFVGTLALLPVLVFFRSTGFELLKQWRPDLPPAKLDQVRTDD